MTVVHLGVRSNGAGGFWLTDAEGNRVIHCDQTADGGRIAIADAEGGEAVVLAADAGGEGHLHLERVGG